MVPEKIADVYKKTVKAFGPSGIKFTPNETKEFSVRTDENGNFIPESVVEHGST